MNEKKRKGLYVIYNVLEEQSSPPMVASSNRHAKRIFDESLKQLPDESRRKEFSLYKIGEFQDIFPWHIDSHAPIALVTGTIVDDEVMDE